MPANDPRFPIREFDLENHTYHDNDESYDLTILDKNENCIWSCFLNPLVTCCGVTEIGRFDECTDQDIQLTDKQFRRAARTLNYVLDTEHLYLAYTIDEPSFVKTIRILTEAGFVQDRQFFNKKSGNVVTQWSKYIVSLEEWQREQEGVAELDKKVKEIAEEYIDHIFDSDDELLPEDDHSFIA